MWGFRRDTARGVSTHDAADTTKPTIGWIFDIVKGDAWADGRPQDDDVTFVVIEVKDVKGKRET